MAAITSIPSLTNTPNSTYNEVAFNEKSAITKENLSTKYFLFTYKYVTLNEKLPITKENLHNFFIGRVECKKQVQTFIGIINYLAKFSLRLSELAEPITELAKDKVPFNWGPEH